MFISFKSECFAVRFNTNSLLAATVIRHEQIRAAGALGTGRTERVRREGSLDGCFVVPPARYTIHHSILSAGNLIWLLRGRRYQKR